MAVLPTILGLVVCIDVNGQDLPEYGPDEEQTESMTVKYIEAITGAEFGVSVRFDAATFPLRDKNISVETSFDGHAAHVKYYQPDTIASPARSVTTGAIFWKGEEMVKRPMLFSSLMINEGAADKRLLGKLNDLGTIEVKCSEVKLEQREQPAATNNKCKWYQRAAKSSNVQPAEPPKPLVENGTISEKTLKGQALTHQATLGEPVAHVGSPWTSTRVGDAFAVYQFKYRSRDALQSLRIIPRSPSPAPLEERPIEDLTADEMRELLRRQKEEKKNTKKAKKEIKRERGAHRAVEDDEDEDVEVVEQKRRKKPRVSEAIELSD